MPRDRSISPRFRADPVSQRLNAANRSADGFGVRRSAIARCTRNALCDSGGPRLGRADGVCTGCALAGASPTVNHAGGRLRNRHQIGSTAQLRAATAYWYQWFFASERGGEALRDNRRRLCDFLWRTWSPTWRFTESEVTQTARSWENPYWVELTLHSYRVRWEMRLSIRGSASWKSR
jgi:hypothetical protein